MAICKYCGTWSGLFDTEHMDCEAKAKAHPTYLILEGAKILAIHGFGSGTPSAALHTVKLEEEGTFGLYADTFFGGPKRIYWAGWGRLEFYIGTNAIQTGGGWSGAGFGLQAAIKGAVTASVLNHLTTRNHEYAVLTVVDHDPASDVEKVCSLGFEKIDEATLTGRLAQAIPSWIEPTVKQLSEMIRQTDKADIPEAMDVIGKYLQRGILAGEQGDRLVDLMREIAPEAFPKPDLPALPTSQVTSASRAEQLKIISELRSSGTLSEEEFQTEKRLILAS